MSTPQEELSDEQLRALYAWIDAIPLSRPKRNIARDFSDGVLFAEVIAAYFPHLVELHNYTTANSVKQKVYNFETLNTRVLRKLDYAIPRNTIDDIVNCRAGTVEAVLNGLQFKMAKYREKKASQTSSSSPSSSPHKSQQQVKSATKAQTTTEKSMKSKINHTQSSKEAILASVDEEILLEKEQHIRELQETVEILELKVAKLEQLVRIKDNKIQKLLQK